MDKYVDDYIPRLKEMFPQVCEKDIKRAVEYGWRMFYFYNLRGCDTLIQSKRYKFWMYCGELRRNSIKHFEYYKVMLRRKIRTLFWKKKMKWDGYYYTYVTQEEYDKYFTKRRARKYFYLTDKISFKIFDEANLFYDKCLYIVKFKYVTDMGYSFRKENLKCTDMEIAYIKKAPLKFEDILINNNNYEAI